jgi:hypothetical protein
MQKSNCGLQRLERRALDGLWARKDDATACAIRSH